MSDEKKPDPVEDLKKGLGLLFRAAKTAVDEIPLPKGGKLEDVVKTGAREVGRAIENVADTIDRELFHKGAPPPPPSPSPGAPQTATGTPNDAPPPPAPTASTTGTTGTTGASAPIITPPPATQGDDDKNDHSK